MPIYLTQEAKVKERVILTYKTRMELEGKAKVVASDWGAEFVFPCHASCFDLVYLKEKVEFILFFEILSTLFSFLSPLPHLSSYLPVLSLPFLSLPLSSLLFHFLLFPSLICPLIPSLYIFVDLDPAVFLNVDPDPDPPLQNCSLT